MVEGDEFERIARDERQREVYRRRKVLYDMQHVMPQAVAARPEMVFVSFASGGAVGVYECKIFYKEPRPEAGLEALTIEARTEVILELHSDANPVVRLVAQKVEELHEARRLAVGEDVSPIRRTFYAKEL